MLNVVPDSAARGDSGVEVAMAGPASSVIDEIVREGAQRMLAAALRAEVAAYCARFADERDANGYRLVVRNGYHEPREVTTAAGAVEVVAPRVNDKRVDPETGERQRFSSEILPPWVRKTPQVAEVLPLLYLHGLSSQDFAPALGQFLGSTKGLSAATITKLTQTWQAEQKAFAARDLSNVDYVYVWANGIHVNVRLEEAKLCLLVLIGVRADGRKELIALTDGYRETTESWADLLRDAKRRGMRAPVLAIGDGALGSGARCGRSSRRPKSSAVGSIRSRISLLHCRNRLSPGRRKRSPRSGTPRTSPTRWMRSRSSGRPTAPSIPRRSPRSPTTSTSYWPSTTSRPNIGCICAPLIRSNLLLPRCAIGARSPRGRGWRAQGIAMAYKLIEAAQSRWRAVNAPHLVALVRAGAKFENGLLVERPDEQVAGEIGEEAA